MYGGGSRSMVVAPLLKFASSFAKHVRALAAHTNIRESHTPRLLSPVILASMPRKPHLDRIYPRFTPGQSRRHPSRNAEARIRKVLSLVSIAAVLAAVAASPPHSAGPEARVAASWRRAPAMTAARMTWVRQCQKLWMEGITTTWIWL